MNDILINALAARVKVDDMKIEQVPVPYQEVIENIISAPKETSD